MLTPAIRAMCLVLLALPLLVTRIRADHQDRAVAADDLALFAHRLYGSSDIHCSGFVSTTGLLQHPRNRVAGATKRPLGPTGKDSRGRESRRGWWAGVGRSSEKLRTTPAARCNEVRGCAAQAPSTGHSSEDRPTPAIDTPRSAPA